MRRRRHSGAISAPIRRKTPKSFRRNRRRRRRRSNLLPMAEKVGCAHLLRILHSGPRRPRPPPLGRSPNRPPGLPFPRRLPTKRPSSRRGGRKVLFSSPGREFISALLRGLQSWPSTIPRTGLAWPSQHLIGLATFRLVFDRVGRVQASVLKDWSCPSKHLTGLAMRKPAFDRVGRVQASVMKGWTCESQHLDRV